jgi:hypothetical protein
MDCGELLQKVNKFSDAWVELSQFADRIENYNVKKQLKDLLNQVPNGQLYMFVDKYCPQNGMTGGAKRKVSKPKVSKSKVVKSKRA